MEGLKRVAIPPHSFRIWMDSEITSISMFSISVKGEKKSDAYPGIVNFYIGELRGIAMHNYIIYFLSKELWKV